MLRLFKNYLLKNRYKETTIQSYLSSIKRISKEEKMDLPQLASCIEQIIPKYDHGGEKESFGNSSHRTPINALKRFMEFIKNTNGGEKESFGNSSHRTPINALKRFMEFIKNTK